MIVNDAVKQQDFSREKASNEVSTLKKASSGSGDSRDEEVAPDICKRNHEVACHERLDIERTTQ